MDSDANQTTHLPDHFTEANIPATVHRSQWAIPPISVLTTVAGTTLPIGTADAQQLTVSEHGTN